LIFDNGTVRGFSRVVRFSPKTRKIIWKYQSDPKEDFFSAGRGGVQLLPGGNVLVANTDSGQAFEITPSGSRVWEYFSEEVGSGKRAALYRFQRFTAAEIEVRLGIPAMGDNQNFRRQ
jgi:outer membrane protein assembly factor BamB